MRLSVVNEQPPGHSGSQPQEQVLGKGRGVPVRSGLTNLFRPSALAATQQVSEAIHTTSGTERAMIQPLPSAQLSPESWDSQSMEGVEPVTPSDPHTPLLLEQVKRPRARCIG